jgi:ketol-acid reductoisomerase
MRSILKDIQTGAFARDWIVENQVNRPNFNRLRAIEARHPIEKVGKELRSMMGWLEKPSER